MQESSGAISNTNIKPNKGGALDLVISGVFKGTGDTRILLQFNDQKSNYISMVSGAGFYSPTNHPEFLELQNTASNTGIYIGRTGWNIPTAHFTSRLTAQVTHSGTDYADAMITVTGTTTFVMENSVFTDQPILIYSVAGAMKIAGSPGHHPVIDSVGLYATSGTFLRLSVSNQNLNLVR